MNVLTEVLCDSVINFYGQLRSSVFLISFLILTKNFVLQDVTSSLVTITISFEVSKVTNHIAGSEMVIVYYQKVCLGVGFSRNCCINSST